MNLLNLKMAFWVLLLIIILGCAMGCATVGNPNIIDQNKISQIKRGDTTKEQVKIIMGEPSKISFSENDEETWDYILQKAQARPSGFIPCVGIFAGGMNIQQYSLTIKFRKDEIVKEMGSGKTIGGAGSVFDK